LRFVAHRGHSRQPFQVAGNVGNRQVSVAVHRKIDGRVSGKLLGRLGVDPGSRKRGYVLMAQRVEVEDPARFIPVR
jgi:hypothetical protein